MGPANLRLLGARASSPARPSSPLRAESAHLAGDRIRLRAAISRTIELATEDALAVPTPDERLATIWIVSSLAWSAIPSATTDDPETSWLILVLNPSYLSSSWLDRGQLCLLTSGELRVV